MATEAHFFSGKVKWPTHLKISSKTSFLCHNFHQATSKRPQATSKWPQAMSNPKIQGAKILGSWSFYMYFAGRVITEWWIVIMIDFWNVLIFEIEMIFIIHVSCLVSSLIQMILSVLFSRGAKVRSLIADFLNRSEQIFTSRRVTWLKLFSNASKDTYLKNFQIMIDWYSSFMPAA